MNGCGFLRTIEETNGLYCNGNITADMFLLMIHILTDFCQSIYAAASGAMTHMNGKNYYENINR